MLALITKLISVAALPVLGIVLFTTSAASVAAQSDKKCTVTVKVTGFHDADGNVRAVLRSGPGQIVQAKIVDIDAKALTAEVVFTEVPEGTYDVALFQDSNKNGEMDFESTGMPLEAYGHSNNPPKRAGEPSFDETKFDLKAPGKTLEVQLVYWP